MEVRWHYQQYCIFGIQGQGQGSTVYCPICWFDTSDRLFPHMCDAQLPFQIGNTPSSAQLFFQV